MNKFGAQSFRGGDDVNGRIPRSDTGDAPADLDFWKGFNFRRFDELDRSEDAAQILTRQFEVPRFTQADTNEYGVVFLFELRERNVAAHFRTLPEFDTEAAHHFHFSQRIRGAQFVSRNSVRVQAAGQFVAVENRDTVAELRELSGACERRGTCADASDTLPVGRPGVKKLNLAVEHVIHGVPLQTPNLDGFHAFLFHHASALAKNLCGANSPAALAEDVGFENHARGTAQIAGEYFLDECGYVNVRGAGDRARCVETVEAARGLDGRLPWRNRRHNFRKILFVLFGRELRCGFSERHGVICAARATLERRHSSTANRRRDYSISRGS